MYTPTRKNCIKGCHGNHAISQGPKVFVFQTHFSHSGCPENNLARMKIRHGDTKKVKLDSVV